MVAEAVYAVPHPGKLASEAVSYLSDDCPTQKLPCHGILSQAATLLCLKEEDEGGWREQSDRGEDQESDIFPGEVKEETQSAHQDVDDDDDKLVMADVTEEEDEDELEESGQDVEECSSPRHSGDESRSKKGRGGPGWRKKSQLKMDHGKQWIVDNLLLVTTTVSVVSLSSIEKAYNNDCQREGQEPLTRFVLARLIHQQFPEAGKSRLGPRGKQKIHYNRLQWRVRNSPNQHHVNGTTSTAAENGAAGGTSSDDIPSTEIQGKGEKQVFNVSCNDEMLQTAKEDIARAALQPVPEEEKEDQEGCENAANRLAQVVKSFKSQGKFDLLLKTFAHSSSCSSLSCSSLCLMFRRVRRHVVSALHACHVMRIYSVLLKVHVAYCKNNNCGMTACPALRASRQMKRGRDDEIQQEENKTEHQQDELQHMTKRLNVQVKRPSSLKIRIPSPPSSLPNSEPCTPSPTISPSHTLPPSPVRIAPLPPLRMNAIARSPTEHGGA